MTDAGDRTKPRWRDSADLVWGAVRLHLRRMVAADSDVDRRDVLAIVSLLGPLALLAGATVGLHDVVWFTGYASLTDLTWRIQFPDAPVWVIWLVVAVLALAGKRRTAAVGAWLGTAGLVLVPYAAPFQRWWIGEDAGWVLLSAVTAIALTWSPGPARARELVRGWAILWLIATTVAAMVMGVLHDGDRLGNWGRPLLLVVGAVVACGAGSRTGRRAALVLLLPVMTEMLARVVLPGVGIYVRHAPDVVVATFYYGIPLVLLLASGTLPRRFPRRTSKPTT